MSISTKNKKKNNIPEYSLKMTNQKGIRMRVSARGELVVHANPFCSKEAIEKYISEHVDEIYLPKKSSSIRLFGKSYVIRKVKGSSNHVSICDHELLIIAKDETCMEKIFDSFLRQNAKDVLSDILDMIFLRFEKLLTKKPSLMIRRMKASWGICHPEKNEITLNLELIHYPVEFIEYVVCHELVHLIEPNHSKAFYEILDQVMPDYKRRIDLIEPSNEKQYLM